MNIELDNIFAKISGENIDYASLRVISDTDKAQVNFALNELFSGLSLLEWMNKCTLADAWKIAMDKLRDYIFSITEQTYIVDYLRHAVFDFRRKTLHDLQSSIHANEFIQYPSDKHPELEESAHIKIQTGMDIIKNLLAQPAYKQPIKNNTKPTKQANIMQHTKENEREYERVKK